MVDSKVYSDVRNINVIADSAQSARLVATLICEGRIPNLYFSIFDAQENADRQPLVMQGRYHAYIVECAKRIDNEVWEATCINILRRLTSELHVVKS